MEKVGDVKNGDVKKRLYQQILEILPGMALAVLLTICAYFLSDLSGKILTGGKNPFSPTLVAILAGLLVRNIFPVPGRMTAGIKFGISKILRFGIILMGIRLSIFSVLRIGAAAIGLIFVCIATALLVTRLLAKKIGISGKLGTLIAAGTSICGVSAVVGVAPAIDANEEETAYAIGIVTLFGLLATITYPYVVELVLGLDVVQAGFFMGTAVHDTSQVTGTALSYDQLWGYKTLEGLTGADIAITTKLVRNTFMIVIIPFLGFWYNRSRVQAQSKARFSLTRYIPVFVIGYVLFGIIRTLGDFAFGADAAAWAGICKKTTDLASYVVAVAITCMGLNTDIRKLAKLGMKPLVIGFSAAVSVGLVSFALVKLFAGYLSF